MQSAATDSAAVLEPDAPTRAARTRRRSRSTGRHAAATQSALRWAGPLGVMVIAAISRLWSLGSPHALMFDETYYVKDAWSLWHLGYEGTWPTSYDPQFIAGHINGYLKDVEFVAHPPLGKWIIGLGEVLAGGATNSVGWRISVAVIGILAVALLMVIAHRLFANAAITTLAGGLFAIDNQAIVMSRVGLLDNIVMFFALASFACLVEDRFWAERRFGRWLMKRNGGVGNWGPTMLWRPWLLAVGALAGFCTGVKWSGLYFLAAFVLYSIASDMMLRRRAGIRFWYSASALKQVPATLLNTVPIAVASYLVCWTGWFVTKGGWDRNYIADGYPRFKGALAWVPDVLQNLWQWHTQVYAFNVGLVTKHPYEAPAILWPLIARPTAMWAVNSSLGQNGCTSDFCTSAVTDIPNPLIWYAGIAATIYLLVRYIRRHEWQAGIVLLGYVGGYLPWLAFPSRTIFFFYTIAFEPYLILCLAATIGLMVLPPPEVDAATDPYDADREIRIAEAHYGVRVRRRIVVAFLVTAVIVSIFYYPWDNGMQTPYWFWHIHVWSTTWA